MVDATAPTLIVTGMHRSGTSLTASLLNSAGVDMGKELNPPAEGNIRGHFEDLAVLKFHENVLKANSLSPEGWVKLQQVSNIPQSCLDQAQEIISSKRETCGITGWKDPRGTLFLDFWESQLAEAKFIFLYRAPWEVVDSLYRRGDQIFQKSPQLALDFWKIYNSAILHFYDRHPEKSLLLNIEKIRVNPDILTDAIAEKFGLHLSIDPSLYDPSLFGTEVSQSPRSHLLQEFFPEVVKTYKKLDIRCYPFLYQETPLNDQQPPFDQNWLLQDWLQLRATQRQCSNLQSELAAVQHAREGLTINLAQTRETLHSTQTELAQTRETLHSTQTELAQTRETLHSTQTELAKKQDKVIKLEDIISAMESSKFWKIRQLWMRLKQLFFVVNL